MSRGIGRAMMEFAQARCRDKRCYKLVLSSNAKRERAHAFYESLGFARHGYSFRTELAPVSRMTEPETEEPLLIAEGLTKSYGRQVGLPRCFAHPLRRRGGGDRRRVRLRQVDPAAASGDAASARRRPRALPDARRHHARSRDARRGGASFPRPHRLGLRPSGPGDGPSHGGVRRRQHRRTADGGRLATLRPDPQHRHQLARARRDRPGADRPHAAHLFRRHAAAAADRAQPRHRSRAWC